MKSKRNQALRRFIRYCRMTNVDRLASDLKNLTLAEHQQLPPKENRTALVYDEECVEHRCLWDPEYPERPERYSVSMQRCMDYGLTERTFKVPARSATDEELLTLHSPEHIETLRKTSGSNDVGALEELSSEYDSTYIHPRTYELARKSAGCSMDLLETIATGKTQNGMAIIRPPGHHAMKNEFCGYCFFNNVALAAKLALDKHNYQRILIIDWDVHHGQATQYFFYDDPRVLYFSIHRYEHGEFWPELRESNFDYVGKGKGKGYNINVPLNKTGLGNADYLAIFNNVLLPVAYEFSPELVLVSSGYDAAIGCPEGLMEVTPAAYAHLLNSVSALAEGRVCVFMEGGYNLKSLAEGVALTLRCLLGDPCPRIGPMPAPLPGSIEAILNVISALRPYWKSLAFQGTYADQTDQKSDRKRHKPEISYVGTLSIKKPEKYPTRDYYLRHSKEVLAQYNERIDRLISETDLSVPLDRVAFVFDQQMALHQSLLEKVHPEKPDRILVMYAKLKEHGLLDSCLALPSRHATDEELLLVHEEEYISRMKNMEKMTPKQLVKIQEEYHSVYFCQASFKCATLAAGSLLNVVDSVMTGKSRSGVAIIRPPGHHAERNEACGFCLFNNISVAAQYALWNHSAKRILIVDWDVHHGNGTQHIFYDNERVLYLSIHRYDNSLFFPFSYEADSKYTGQEQGIGFNVNIPWNKGRMGDGDYMAAFFQLVLPIAQQFDPDLVLVSCGFDAAKGDPLGGCRVTSDCYGHMTHLLTSLAGGRVILALEGGYNVPVISDCMSACVSALLGQPLPSMPVGLKPCQSAVETILQTVSAHREHWSCLQFDVDLPEFIGEIEATPQASTQLSSLGSPLDDEAGASGVTAPPPTPVGSLFCVKPLDWCPHLDQLPTADPPNFDINAPCLVCRDVTENWMCLSCYEICCARYVNGHMKEHSTVTNHPLTISFSDLSIWCYVCEAYIDNEAIHPIKDLAHRKKFGVSIRDLQ